SANTLLTNGNNLVTDKSSLKLALDNLKDASDKLKGVENNLDDVLKKAGVFVGNTNQNVDARMKELSVALQNLKVVTTYLKEFSKQIAEKPNRVIFTGKPSKLTTEDSILKNPQPVPAKPAQ